MRPCGLTAELFQRWLVLFRETAAAQPNQAMAGQACLMAERIAQSLWLGYQMSHGAADPAQIHQLS